MNMVTSVKPPQEVEVKGSQGGKLLGSCKTSQGREESCPSVTAFGGWERAP